MRTTVELDEDVARAVERVRIDEGLGVSEAVNALIRRGLLPRNTPRFQQRTRSLGLRVDVGNVAAVIEDLDSSESR